MKNNLSSIKNPIATDIKAYQKVFKETVRSKITLLDLIMRYILKTKGKEIRPIIVLYSAKLLGEINPSTYNAATLIELLHTATLVHDDVVDESNRRRGMFSINALWKNKIAVLSGDFLLAKGLLLAVENKQYHLLEYVSKATRDMSEGELLQAEKARKTDISEDLYFEVIRKKTASLLASCFATGAYSVNQDKELIEKLWKIGENTGIAFQIMDDLLDFDTKGTTGKPTGTDLKEKKVTLPLIYLLNHSNKKEKKHLLKLIKKKNKDKETLKILTQRVHNSGGFAYAEEMMNKYKQKAIDLLREFPENDARNALEEIIHYIVNREK